MVRTYTVTKREGEWLGPVDWDYDFLARVRDRKKTERYVGNLRHIVAILHRGGEVWSGDSGGFYHRVVHAGMYDGWPWWEPTPAILVEGPLGPTEKFFYQCVYVQVQSLGEG